MKTLKIRIIMIFLVFSLFISVCIPSPSYANPAAAATAADLTFEAFASAVTVVTGGKQTANTFHMSNLYNKYKKTVDTVKGIIYMTPKMLYLKKGTVNSISSFVSTATPFSYVSSPTYSPSFPKLSSKIIDYGNILIPAERPNHSNFISVSSKLRYKYKEGNFINRSEFIIQYSPEGDFNKPFFSEPVDLFPNAHFNVNYCIYVDYPYVHFKVQYFNYRNELESSKNSKTLTQMPYYQDYVILGFPELSSSFNVNTHYQLTDVYYDNKKIVIDGNDYIAIPRLEPQQMYKTEGMVTPILSELTYGIDSDSLEVWRNALQENINQNTAEISELRQALDSLSNTVISLNDRLGVISADIPRLSGRIDTLGNDVSVSNAERLVLDGRVNTLDTTVSNLDERLGSISADIPRLSDRVGTLGDDLISVRNTQDGLNNRLGDLETGVASTNQRIGNLENNVTSTNEKLGNMEKSWTDHIPIVSSIADLIRRIIEMLKEFFKTVSDYIAKMIAFLSSVLAFLETFWASLTTAIENILKKFFDPTNFNLDFSQLKVNLQAKFPFCIPFDFLNAIKLFSASAVAPNLHIKIDYLNLDYQLDLGIVNYARLFFRSVAVIWYATFLMIKTRDFIKW